MCPPGTATGAYNPRVVRVERETQGALGLVGPPVQPNWKTPGLVRDPASKSHVVSGSGRRRHTGAHTYACKHVHVKEITLSVFFFYHLWSPHPSTHTWTPSGTHPCTQKSKTEFSRPWGPSTYIQSFRKSLRKGNMQL